MARQWCSRLARLVAAWLLVACVAPGQRQVHAAHDRQAWAVTSIFALGDSVMLGAAPELARRGITVDAVESRQFVTGIDIVRWMRAAGRLPGRVVIDLGTNGPISNQEFDAMMQPLQGARLVVFLTVKEPRWWESEVNDVLRAGVARWPHTRLLDWYAASLVNPGWFWDDGIHLRPEGALAYARLVVAAVAERPAGHKRPGPRRPTPEQRVAAR